MRARDNPFRVERLRSLAYRAPGFSWKRLLARLDDLGGRGAIRGPRGSGKTTLLEGLERRLRSEGLQVLRLRAGSPGSALGPAAGRARAEGAALLVDGLDRLGPAAWWGLRRRSGSLPVLVATTHRRGRLATLHRCETSPELFLELVKELAPELRPPASSIRHLWALHEGDLHRAFRELYDLRTGSPLGSLSNP